MTYSDFHRYMAIFITSSVGTLPPTSSVHHSPKMTTSFLSLDFFASLGMVLPSSLLLTLSSQYRFDNEHPLVLREWMPYSFADNLTGQIVRLQREHWRDRHRRCLFTLQPPQHRRGQIQSATRESYRSCMLYLCKSPRP